jgi:hypothetical protein
VLHIDPEHEPDRARRAFDSHLSRAKWMLERGGSGNSDRFSAEISGPALWLNNQEAFCLQSGSSVFSPSICKAAEQSDAPQGRQKLRSSLGNTLALLTTD